MSKRIRAVRLTSEAAVYVENQGRQMFFTVDPSPDVAGFNLCKSIEFTEHGVLIEHSRLLDKISHRVEVFARGVIRVSLYDEDQEPGNGTWSTADKKAPKKKVDSLAKARAAKAAKRKLAEPDPED